MTRKNRLHKGQKVTSMCQIVPPALFYAFFRKAKRLTNFVHKKKKASPGIHRHRRTERPSQNQAFRRTRPNSDRQADKDSRSIFRR